MSQINKYINSFLFSVDYYLSMGYVFMISLTYDNGDKSDNWCDSHTKVPKEIFGPELYDAPICGQRNAFYMRNAGIKKAYYSFFAADFAICM